jgi:hypothetical protein
MRLVGSAVCAVFLALAIAAGSVSVAEAASSLVTVPLAPTLAIEPVPSQSSDRTPVLRGTAATAAGDATSVTITVAGGAGGVGPYTATVPVLAGAWSLSVPQLAEGTYIATVTQLVGGVTVHTVPVSFTVDLTPPALTLDTPVEGSFTSGSSELVSGHAGVAAGDLSAITVDLYTGATIAAGQIPLESIVVQATDGEWSVTVAGLALGTYTVRAGQSDDADNLAVSATATFQVLAPASSPPSPATTGHAPAASFTWLPLTPRVDEPVALLSTATAGDSPLTEFEWATTPLGPFELVGPAHTMTFTSPGEHLIRLQVTAADGLSSTVSKEISVLHRVRGLMDPFPIVQLAGAYSGRGVDLKLLRVQVPLGTHVIVHCAGRACPVAWEKYEAAPGHGSLVPVEFHSFERAMPAGVTISVRVFQGEEIGKFTRFVVRAGRPPVRTDMCLSTSEKPVRCPA